MDKISALQQITEKYRNARKKIYCIFVLKEHMIKIGLDYEVESWLLNAISIVPVYGAVKCEKKWNCKRFQS